MKLNKSLKKVLLAWWLLWNEDLCTDALLEIKFVDECKNGTVLARGSEEIDFCIGEPVAKVNEPMITALELFDLVRF